MPAEGGALDAGGEGMDAGESGEVADLFRRLAGGDDLLELVEERLGFGGGLAFDLRGHERGGGLGNGAAGAFETDRINAAVVGEVQGNGAIIAATGVFARGHAVGGRRFAAIAGALVVVEDDRLIEIGDIGHGRNDQ